MGTVEHGGDLDDQSRGLWADHATRCDHSSLYGARHDHFQPAGHDYGDERGGPYTERDGAGALLRSGVGDGDYPLFGSFLNFYRSMPSQLWSEEFGWMRQIDMNTIVLASAGALLPNGSDPRGTVFPPRG